MAITLPDIVQRVVLDTRRFSPSAKGITADLEGMGSSAARASAGIDDVGDSHERTTKRTKAHGDALSGLRGRLSGVLPTFRMFRDEIRKAGKDQDDHHKALKKSHTLWGKTKSILDIAAGSFIKIGLSAMGLFSAVIMLAPTVGALGGALVSLVGSMSGLIGILPALSGLMVGLVAVLASVLTMFSGVKTAMDQQSRAATGAASTQKAVAKAQASGAKQIAAAQKAVVTATRSVVTARRAEAEAYVAVAQAQRDAMRSVEASTHSLIQAQLTYAESQSRVRSAQDALNKSYDEARQHLVDLRREAERADIAQQRSEITLRSAQESLQNLLSGADADPDAVLSALLDVQSAELDAADATDNLNKTKAELADAERKGVSQSDIVLQARKDLADATRAEAEAVYDLRNAELDLEDAQVSAAKAVADARQNAADATQALRDAEASLVEAKLGVGEARQNAAEGVANARESGSGASKTGKVASAEAQAIAKALLTAKKQLEPLKKTIQSLTFRDVIKGIKGATVVGLSFQKQLGGTAKIISSHIASLPGHFARAKPDIDAVWKSNDKLLTSVTNLGGVSIGAFAKMSNAGKGILDGFAKAADDVAARIVKALAAPGAFERMQAFFERAQKSAVTWWRIIRDFTVGLVHVFSASSIEGNKMSEGIAKTAKHFREWTGDEKNRKKMQEFFQRAHDLASKLWGFVKEIASALGEVATGPGIEAIGSLFESFGEDKKGKKSTLKDTIVALSNSAITGGVDAIKSLMKIITGPGGKNKNALGDFGESLTLMSGMTGTLSLIATLTLDFVKAIAWGSENIPGFSTALGVLGGVMLSYKAAEKLGLVGAVKGIRKGLKLLRGDEGDTRGAITRIKDALHSKMDKVKSAWTTMRTAMTNFTDKLRLAVDAARSWGKKVITMAVDNGKAAASWALMKAKLVAHTVATQAAAAAQWLLNAAMSANPIMLIVIGLAALGAALFLAYKNIKPFRRFVDSLWQGFQKLWDIILEGVRTVIRFVSKHWKTLLLIFGGPIGALVVLIATHFKTIWSTIRRVFSGIRSTISTVWGRVTDILGGVGRFLTEHLSGPFETAVGVIGDVLGGLGDVISTAMEGARSALNTSLRLLGNIVAPFIRVAATVVGAIGMDSLSESLKGTAKSVDNWGEKAAGDRFTNAKRKPSRIGGGFKSGVPKAIVGEGSRFPEYIIPTDPRYRGRAKMLASMLFRDLSHGPTGAFGVSGGRAVEGEHGWGDVWNNVRHPSRIVKKVEDAVRGFGADRLEDLWPKVPSKYSKSNFMGIPGNILNKIRDSVLWVVRGRTAEEIKKKDAASGSSSGIPMADKHNPDFKKLWDRYRRDFGFDMVSGWRSYESQKRLWDRYGHNPRRAARPGTSNHERGIAIDHSPRAAKTVQAAARRYGLRYPMSWEPWHVEPINKRHPLDGVPDMGKGGLVTRETLARIGELNKPEAVVPLDSPTGRRMLGTDKPSVSIDLSNMKIETGNPDEIRKAVKAGVSEALTAVSEYVEIDFQ